MANELIAQWGIISIGNITMDSPNYFLIGTASWASNAISASYSLSSSYNFSSSYALSSSYGLTSSYALTASSGVGAMIAWTQTGTSLTTQISKNASVSRLSAGVYALLFSKPTVNTFYATTAIGMTGSISAVYQATASLAAVYGQSINGYTMSFQNSASKVQDIISASTLCFF